MGTFKNRKTGMLFCASIVGVLIAILAYQGATTYLIDYGNGKLGSYKLTDLYNVILVTDNFDKYEYMIKNNIFLFLYPVMFFGGGIVVCASGYLLKPKSYQSLVCGKSRSKKEAMQKILGRKHLEAIVYTVSYFSTITVLSYLFLPQLWEMRKINKMILTKELLIYMIVSFIYLMAFNAFVFLIYRWKNESFAFFSFFIVISLIFAVDKASSNFSIILFNDVNNFCDDIIIGGVMWFLFRFLEKNVIKFSLIN